MNFKTKPGTKYLVMAGTRALRTRAGERYVSDGENLVLQSDSKKSKILGPIADVLRAGYFRECEPLLDYPLLAVGLDAKGQPKLMRYDIPANERAKVLKAIWPFAGKPPALNEERYDLHAGKRFKVGDFAVFREDEANFLVSPFYPEGGTVIDWMPADWEEGKA